MLVLPLTCTTREFEERWEHPTIRHSKGSRHRAEFLKGSDRGVTAVFPLGHCFIEGTVP